MTTQNDHELAQWAMTGMTKPRRTVVGPAAAAEGRAMLEAAGVDIAAIERRVGRPRLDGASTNPKGHRSPRVNVAVSDATDAAIEARRTALGLSRSDLVRQALDLYLAS